VGTEQKGCLEESIRGRTSLERRISIGAEQKGCLEESIRGRISTGEDDIHRKISLGRASMGAEQEGCLEEDIREKAPKGGHPWSS